MNEVTNTYNAALVMVFSLGRGDQCRLVDHVCLNMGEFVPVPAFEDSREDFKWWCENTPEKMQIQMFVEFWGRLSPSRQRDLQDWIAKNLKEHKAEPPAG